MDKSKRRFLKLVAWAPVAVPAVGHVNAAPEQSAVSRTKGMPQADVGGGMGGVDFSRYIDDPFYTGALDGTQPPRNSGTDGE